MDTFRVEHNVQRTVPANTCALDWWSDIGNDSVIHQTKNARTVTSIIYIIFDESAEGASKIWSLPKVDLFSPQKVQNRDFVSKLVARRATY